MEERAQRIVEQLQREPEKQRCADFLAGLPELQRQEILNTLAYDRLRYKMELVESLYRDAESDWNQTFYLLYFRTLGDTSNRQAYLTLAERVPYRVLLHERSRRNAVEALLLGTSGLLTLYEPDAYVRELLAEFGRCRVKYQIEPMEASEWKLSNIRPANHPLLRIVQAARFFARDEYVIHDVLKCRTPKEVQTLFGVEATDYWSRHYTPGAEHDRHPKRIGKFKSDMFAINLVAILLLAYANRNGKEEVREQGMQLYHATGPEDNRIIRGWCNAGVPAPADAFESQALLQLRRAYCETGRCAACPVGRRIVDRVLRAEERQL